MHSYLLEKFLLDSRQAATLGKPVLDLACGGGRNGLYLLSQGIPVVFADVKQAVLDEIKAKVESEPETYDLSLAKFWCVDFEADGFEGLEESAYAAIIVFRYLHRPLMASIRAAVSNSGFVIYETFTLKQAELGRPKNPNFLLKPKELNMIFSDWQILHQFEGEIKSDTGDNLQAVAQLVARKR